MNIFMHITYRTMKQNRMRTIVTIIGVILSTAMITAVTSFGYSFWSFLKDYSMEHDGAWYGAAYHVSDEELDRILSEEEVEKAAATDILGFAEFETLTSERVPYLYVQSLPAEVWDMCPVALEKGRLPENENEVIIPWVLSANQKEGEETRIGDILTLQTGVRMINSERISDNSSYIDGTDEYYGGNGAETLSIEQEIQVTVVGIYSQAVDVYQPAAYNILAGPSGQGRLSEYHNVYLCTDKAGDIYDYLQTIDCEGTTVNIGYLRWLGAVENDNVTKIIIGLLAVIIGIIMAGAVSLIYNAFSISLRERTVQFGLLSSVGATKKQLRSALRCEAIAVSLIGIPAGCTAGIAGIGITLHFIGSGLANLIQGKAMDIPLRISWFSLLAAVLTAIATVMISVWIPCRRVRKLSPLEALRSGKDIRIRGKDVKVSGISYRLFGLPGMLAQKNYRRDRKKYRSTVASLTMSILLFVSVSSFGKYLISSGSFVLEMPDVQLIYSSYDEDLKTAESRMEQAKKLIGENENVTFIQEYGVFRRSFAVEIPAERLEEDFKNACLRSGFMSQSEEGNLFLNLSLIVLPDQVFDKTAEERYGNEGSGLPVLYPSQMKVKDPYTQKYEKGEPFYSDMSGTALNVQEYDEEGKTTVMPLCEMELTGVYEKAPQGVNYSDYGVTLLTSESGFREYLEMHKEIIFPAFELGVQCEDHGEVYRELTDKLKQTGNEGEFFDNASEYEEKRQILMAISVLSYGFIILISLIAVANVFNTISTNLMLRRKEFAMLRSVGMDSRGFRRMMCYECLIYGMRSIIYGIILSLFVSVMIWKVLEGGVNTDYIVPWEYLGIAVVSVFLVVAVTMVYTMRLIRRENIIDELKMD